ncbi:MAG TPA: glycosyltransferase family 39 protein, partial [Anaerolineales bacterium]|nr:glycosyltransferase family 39 protein [Anaerolineales bacterium]
METWRRRFFSRWGEWSLLGVIVLAGFVLRLYQLGEDSFWIDEVGIINAVRQHGLGEALAAARHHVMAMPLDYVVVWAWGKFTPLDTWLRLPAALWGALTVIPAYLLYRRLGDAPLALWGAFFLACAPFHIQYSQELHFYAALTFFYTLTTWLLLRAVEEAKVKPWVVALAALLVGFY